LDHSKKAVNYKGIVVSLLRLVKEQEINSVQRLKRQLSCARFTVLGSAVINIPGVISIMDHTHFKVTKDNYSMQKLIYLGPH